MWRQITWMSEALLLGALARAQVVSPVAAANDAATLVGNGEKPGLTYAGEQVPLNVLLGELAYEGAYDDNPLGASSGSAADGVQAMGGNLLLQHQGEHLQATAGYQPYYERFLTYTQYDQFDQFSSADIRLVGMGRWSSRVRDSYSRQNEPYAPLSAAASSGAPAAPGGLNGTVYTPLARMEANSARLDLVYQSNPRGFLNVFGGYEQRSFSQTATSASLYKTRGPATGAELAWRPSEHAIVGVLGVFQRLEFPGASGIPPRIEIASVLPTWASAPWLGWQLQAYAGPQIWAQPQSAAGSAQRSLAWAAGGTVSRQGERTAFFLKADHVLADGGGALSVVESTTVGGGLRHQVVGRCDGSLQAGWARNSALDALSGAGTLNEASASADLARPLRGNMIWHLQYDFVRQLASAGAPGLEQFHRTRIATGLSWRFGAHPLGR